MGFQLWSWSMIAVIMFCTCWSPALFGNQTELVGNRERLLNKLEQFTSQTIGRHIQGRIDVRVPGTSESGELRFVLDDYQGSARRFEVDFYRSGALDYTYGYFFRDTYFVRAQVNTVDGKPEVTISGLKGLKSPYEMVHGQISTGGFFGISPVFDRDENSVFVSQLTTLPDGAEWSVAGAAEAYQLISQFPRGWLKVTFNHKEQIESISSDFYVEYHGRNHIVTTMDELKFDDSTGVLMGGKIVESTTSSVGGTTTLEFRLAVEQLGDSKLKGPEIRFQKIDVKDGTKVAMTNDGKIRYEIINGEVYRVLDADALQSISTSKFRARNGFSYQVAYIGVVLFCLIGTFGVLYRRKKGTS